MRFCKTGPEHSVSEGNGMDTPKRARNGKPQKQTRGNACSPTLDLQSAQERIRQAARTDKGLRFTALWHHVYNIEQLRNAYFGTKRHAAPGMDGQTWQQYGENLEENLRDLSVRLQRGAYRAKPVKRAYVPKEDGSDRPIGIPVLEDKIVQRATVAVLNAIYEEDFLGFSYGFRPKRGQHDALDALSVAISSTPVNWILDADIKGFFDAVNQDWLIRFLRHRIGDERIIRLVQKWLKAGVLEEGQWQSSDMGTPQGAVISPLLANIYLHYVFDLLGQAMAKARSQRQSDRGEICRRHCHGL
jgi:group II intron reverse transcriptase/maturase